MNNSEQIIYRQYQPSDKDAAWNLHISVLKEIGGFFKDTTGRLDSDFKDIEGTYLVGGDFIIAESGGKMVGMGALRKIDGETGEIKRMRVLSDFRGHGIGKTILVALEQKARNFGYKKLILDTTSKNLAAQHFYESFGYQETGRKVYDPAQDVSYVYYQKILQPVFHL
jgi:ribosomal protein S18 acetylase RimI-like enzyme